jgi:hypothetical protein
VPCGRRRGAWHGGGAAGLASNGPRPTGVGGWRVRALRSTKQGRAAVTDPWDPLQSQAAVV